MRWAFWRRQTRTAAPDPLSAATWPPRPPDPPTAGTRPPLSSADGSEDRRPVPAFSGAVPLPGEQEQDSSLLPPLDRHPPVADAGRDLGVVRADLVALVGAAAVQDAAAADEVLQVLADSGDDGLAVACLAMLAVLGERLVLAAGHQLDAGPDAAPEVVAQGQTVARRADTLLRAVAPSASPDLVRLAVRCAAGVLDQDPVVGHLVEQPLEELARVTAVLLAQTVADGQGSQAELAEELEDLLPG